MSPAASALLSVARAAPIPNGEITDANREALRELYRAGLIDFYEPLPGFWKPTLSGRHIEGD